MSTHSSQSVAAARHAPRRLGAADIYSVLLLAAAVALIMAAVVVSRSNMKASETTNPFAVAGAKH